MTFGKSSICARLLRSRPAHGRLKQMLRASWPSPAVTKLLLGPITEILLIHSYTIRRAKNPNVFNLCEPHGIYRARDGVYVRAMAPFIVGMLPQLPGLVCYISPQIGGISRSYVSSAPLSWIESFIFARYKASSVSISTLTQSQFGLLSPSFADLLSPVSFRDNDGGKG